MTRPPGQTPQEPQSGIRAGAVPVCCPSPQCVPAPASPLQRRQSLPRTHRHGCCSTAPLPTTEATGKKKKENPKATASPLEAGLGSLSSAFFFRDPLQSKIPSSLCSPPAVASLPYWSSRHISPSPLHPEGERCLLIEMRGAAQAHLPACRILRFSLSLSGSSLTLHRRHKAKRQPTDRHLICPKKVCQTVVFESLLQTAFTCTDCHHISTVAQTVDVTAGIGKI